MKAAIIHSFGPPSVLEVSNLPQPQAEAGSILIKVRASSVNPIDYKIRSGNLKLLSGNRFPKMLGADFAGEVIESGSAEFKTGDEVYGMLDAVKGGAYAEYLKSKPRQMFRKPSNLSFEEAAVLPIVSLTAIQALVKLANIQHQQHIFINGCTGGVGTIAVQVASIFKAQITGVCSGKNIHFAKELGVHSVIDYTKEKIPATGNYDIIFDTIGNLSFSQMKKSLVSGGIMISTSPNPSNLISSVGSVFSSTKLKLVVLRPDKADFEQLTKWIEQGFIKPVIEKSYPLSDIITAHEHIETGHTRGKIAIRISV